MGLRLVKASLIKGVFVCTNNKYLHLDALKDPSEVVVGQVKLDDVFIFSYLIKKATERDGSVAFEKR